MSLYEWKKVFEKDLDYIIPELMEILETPACIILSGPVGAGKTTFTKYFKKQIQNDESENDQILSPTYSLVNESGRLVHADLYRIQSKSELIHLELPLYLEGKDYVLIEWGMPYLSFLKDEIDGAFKFYELSISINDSKDDSGKDDNKKLSRNFSLKSLDI